MEKKSQEMKRDLDELMKVLKAKETKQRIAKHKLEEVKRNIKYGDKELEKLEADPELAYKIHSRQMKLPNTMAEFLEFQINKEKKQVSTYKGRSSRNESHPVSSSLPGLGKDPSKTSPR